MHFKNEYDAWEYWQEGTDNLFLFDLKMFNQWVIDNSITWEEEDLWKGVF